MTARHHHYLSQCYLKGFTSGQAKKSKLTILDFKEKKYFETIPRNVGGLRDFNRIDAEGIAPDHFENALSNFESSAAHALKRVNEGAKFEGEIKLVILNLIALLAIRSPEQRENWRQFQAQIVERMMDLTLVSKERWQSQLDQMKASGGKVNENVTYEDMKAFVESKAYKIEVAREFHIHREMVGVDSILPCLINRNWLVIRATDQSGPFITTDHPVLLLWREPDSIPPFYRNHPGFGLKGTQVFFPISSKVALVGEFEGEEDDIFSDERLVAVFNTMLINKLYKQLYASKLLFPIINEAGELVSGKTLLKALK